MVLFGAQAKIFTKVQIKNYIYKFYYHFWDFFAMFVYLKKNDYLCSGYDIII